VARALLEDKAVVGAAMAATASPARIPLTGPRGISSSTFQQLLQLRENLLITSISGAMAAASRGASSSKEGAAAAGQAFDDNLDLVVELGWAHVERLCLQIFLSEVGRAPTSLQVPLASVAWLYGATRVEKRQSSLLAAGVIGAADVAALRQAVNDACKELGGNGAKPALRLCEGFAIPDHLLQAPIAFDWRSIGC
jgi:acyl-CoA oxidase